MKKLNTSLNSLLLFLMPVFFCSGSAQAISGDGETIDSSRMGSDGEEIHPDFSTFKSYEEEPVRRHPRKGSGDSNSTLNIISRKEWDDQELEDDSATRPSPVLYVVVTQNGERCMNASECADKMKELSNSTPVIYFESFYIGEDGQGYEGLGWDTYKKYLVGGIYKWSLWVTFWGNFQDVVPLPPAIDAFKGLIKTGISLGKISTDYKLTSVRSVLEDKEYLLDKFLEELKGWDRYTDHIEAPSEREHPTAGLFPIVFREEWNAAKQVNLTFEPVFMPIENVLVINYSFRCFTIDCCIRIMQEGEKLLKAVFGGVPFNFYVGEDGLAYEGRGWDFVPSMPEVLPKMDLPKNLIAVGFRGDFKSIKPSQSALLAFNKLLRFGVTLGKISPNYKIVSGRSLAEFLVGDALHSELIKMERYSDTLILDNQL